MADKGSGAAVGAVGNGGSNGSALPSPFPPVLTGLPFSDAALSSAALKAKAPIGWKPRFVVAADFGNKNGGYSCFMVPPLRPDWATLAAKPTLEAMGELLQRGELQSRRLNVGPWEPLPGQQGRETMMLAVEKDEHFNARVPDNGLLPAGVRTLRRWIRVADQAIELYEDDYQSKE